LYYYYLSDSEAGSIIVYLFGLDLSPLPNANIIIARHDIDILNLATQAYANVQSILVYHRHIVDMQWPLFLISLIFAMIPPLVSSTEGLLRRGHDHEESLDDIHETRALELELHKLEDEHKAKRVEMQSVQEDIKRRLEMRTKLQEEIARAEAILGDDLDWHTDISISDENKHTRIRRQAKGGASKTQQDDNEF